MSAIKLNNEVKFIPEWIIEKNLDENQIYAVRAESEDAELVRETEKAILVEWSTEFGKVSMWCPKSVLKSKDEVVAEAKAQQERYNNACEQYAKLVETAKSLGVKVRKGMYKITIWDKAIKAGKDAELRALLNA